MRGIIQEDFDVLLNSYAACSLFSSAELRRMRELGGGGEGAGGGEEEGKIPKVQLRVWFFQKCGGILRNVTCSACDLPAIR